MMKIGQRIFKDIKKFWPIPIIAVVLYVLLHKLRGACCPAVLLLGLPCPGCGTVRASLYVLKGQFAQAFYMNPTVYLWIAFLLYVIVVRYILGKPLKHMVGFLAVIGVLMVIRYSYGMYMYYPTRPPFSYTNGSILEENIPGYMDIVSNFNIGG